MRAGIPGCPRSPRGSGLLPSPAGGQWKILEFPVSLDLRSCGLPLKDSKLVSFSCHDGGPLGLKCNPGKHYSNPLFWLSRNGKNMAELPPRVLPGVRGNDTQRETRTSGTCPREGDSGPRKKEAGHKKLLPGETSIERRLFGG